MNDSLNPGETIQLQLSGAQVLAMVRYCRLNGDQFVIGVERVDEWLVAEDSHASAAAKCRHGRIASNARTAKGQLPQSSDYGSYTAIVCQFVQEGRGPVTQDC